MNVKAESEWGQMNIVKGKEAEFVFILHEWFHAGFMSVGWSDCRV